MLLLRAFIQFYSLYLCERKRACLPVGSRGVWKDSRDVTEVAVPAFAPSGALLAVPDPPGVSPKAGAARSRRRCVGDGLSPAAAAAAPSGSFLLWIRLVAGQLSPVACPTQGGCLTQMLLRQQKKIISGVLT